LPSFLALKIRPQGYSLSGMPRAGLNLVDLRSTVMI
jgi:hypothetical protein